MKNLITDFTVFVNEKYSFLPLTEDDKKVLCLMVNEEDIKIGESIPFIRTLFKGSIHYQEQVYHRDDMTFTNTRTLEVMNYIDCDF